MILVSTAVRTRLGTEYRMANRFVAVTLKPLRTPFAAARRRTGTSAGEGQSGFSERAVTGKLRFRFSAERNLIEILDRSLQRNPNMDRSGDAW